MPSLAAVQVNVGSAATEKLVTGNVAVCGVLLVSTALALKVKVPPARWVSGDGARGGVDSHPRWLTTERVCVSARTARGCATRARVGNSHFAGGRKKVQESVKTETTEKLVTG